MPSSLISYALLVAGCLGLLVGGALGEIGMRTSSKLGSLTGLSLLIECIAFYTAIAGMSVLFPHTGKGWALLSIFGLFGLVAVGYGIGSSFRRKGEK